MSGQKPGLQKHHFLLIVSLCLILLGSFFASMIMTNWGRVKVSTVTFPTRDGQQVVADLYRPVTATRNSKAPLMIIIPGFQRTRETMAHISLEFARRGVVVIAFDPTSQGDSSSSAGGEGRSSAQIEAYGAVDLVDFVFSGVLSYIDLERVGVYGHSMGGNAAKYLAGQRPGKIRAGFISGYVLAMDAMNNVNSNFGMDYPFYDEGAFRNEDVGVANRADMRYAHESRVFVNSGGSFLSPGEPVEIGRIYGNPFDGTMRQVFNVPTIHAMQPYSSRANTNMLLFFEVAFDIETSSIADMWIDNNRHVWQIKELFTTIALIGAFMFIVPFAALLFKIPFFKTAKYDVPEPREKRVWWERI